MSHVALNALCDEFRAGDKLLLSVLTEMGVKPASEIKFGRGVMRTYNRADINAPAITERLNARRESAAKRAAEIFGKSRFPIEAAKAMTTPERVARIEAKLDIIMSALGLKFNGNSGQQ